MAARVESVDIQGSLDETIAAPSLMLGGQGQVQTGRTLMQAGDMVGRIAADMQERRNELLVQDGMEQFLGARRTALLGDGTQPGALATGGMEAVGLTARYGERLKTELDRTASNMENGVQRRAFERKAGQALASTLDTLAAHEADSNEKTRVAKATANYQESMAHYVATNPTAFLARPNLGDPDIGVADQTQYLLTQAEDYLKSTNRNLDDETVTTLAKFDVANKAHEAAINMLNEGGAMAIADGRKFLEQYGELWSTDQRRTLQVAVDHQIGLATMLDVVPEVMAQAQAGDFSDDPVKMRNVAVAEFQRRYSSPEKGAGKPAPPEFVDEMSRRMLAEYNLITQAAEQRAAKHDDVVLGGFFKVLSDPAQTQAGAERAYQEAWSKLDPTRESALSTLLGFKQNFADTRSPFANATDETGFRAQVMSESQIRNLTNDRVFELVAHMDKTDGKAFLTRYTGIRDRGTPDQTKQLIAAVQEARALQRAVPLDPQDDDDAVELSRKVVLLRNLVDQSAQGGREKPLSQDELMDLATIVDYRTDNPSRSLWAEGASEVMSDYLLNPNPEPLRLAEPHDRGLAQIALGFLKSSPAAYYRFLDEAGAATEAAALQALAARPRLLQSALRSGLSRPDAAKALRESMRRAEQSLTTPKPLSEIDFGVGAPPEASAVPGGTE